MDTNPKTRSHPGNMLLAIVAVLVILAGLYYGCSYFLRQRYFEETNDAQVESYINPVSARTGGYIKQVRFEDHEQVKAGDTLIILDDRENRQRVTEAAAAVDDSRAQLSVLIAGISAAQTATLVNKDQIAGAKARLVLQQADIKRYHNLVREEAVTGSDLESVQSRYDISLSDYSGAQNNLLASFAKIKELRSRKALLAADLKKKMAELELARLNLSYTVIVAPYAGRLGKKTILEGQQIQPGQPLVAIVDEKDKWVSANFKETQVDGMYTGQPVEISIDATGDKIYEGVIEAISASTGAKFSILPPDNSTGNFVKIVQRVPVKIRFVSRDIGYIKAGMNAWVAVKKRAE